MNDDIDTLWDERQELIKADDYEGDDDLQCTCDLDIGVDCPVHPDKVKIEKELED